MNWKRLIIVIALSMMLVLSSTMVAAAMHRGGDPTATLLVSGLEELQGSTIGPDGALYVTAPLAGSIWRVDPKTGDVTLFASGLPARNPDPFFVGAGVVDVTFLDGTAYALVTGVGPDLEPGRTDTVGIYRIDSPTTSTVIADIGAFAEANPPKPDFFVPTGFQYAIQTFRGEFLVTDAHHNRLLWVTRAGDVSEVVAFRDVVPTGLDVRANRIYIGQAGPIPHKPRTSKIFSLSLRSPDPKLVATGAGLRKIGLLVDVEFGREGRLYALLQGDWNGPFEGTPADPNTGALVKVDKHGTFEVVVGGLNMPTSFEFIKDTAYVVSLAGEVWKIEDVSD